MPNGVKGTEGVATKGSQSEKNISSFKKYVYNVMFGVYMLQFWKRQTKNRL